MLAARGLLQARKQSPFSMYTLDPQGLERGAALITNLLNPKALPTAAHPGGNPNCCR